MAGSGMDMMIAALLKSVGFNPQQFLDHIGGFIASVESKLKSFDARMTEQEELLREINRKLDLLVSDKAPSDKTLSENLGAVILEAEFVEVPHEKVA